MNPDLAEDTGTAPDITPEPSQETPETPIEQELNRDTKQRTPAEKAAYTLKKNAESVAALGLDPAEVLGIQAKAPTQEPEGDIVPEWFKKYQQQEQSKTAEQLADAIEDPKERELVKLKLSTVITSGSPEERVRVARGYVNAVKTGQIAEELGRAGTARTFSSGAGAPPGTSEKEPEFSALEQSYMRPPFSLTKEQVLAARPKD